MACDRAWRYPPDAQEAAGMSLSLGCMVQLRVIPMSFFLDSPAGRLRPATLPCAGKESVSRPLLFPCHKVAGNGP
ncbi:MAG: hypothetical protein HOO93_05055 [Methyloglobulus sp.]|nr:hypothetical protein [Methyloglobulus sp.]